MADAAGDETDQDFARLRLGQVDLLHLEGPTELFQHRGPDLQVFSTLGRSYHIRFLNRPDAQKPRVDPDQPPPYGAYAAIMAAFAGGLAGAGAVARALDRDPHEHTALDLATLALATFKAARTIARDPVTSFIREPLVEDEHEGGMQQALGELVNCTRCTGTWVAGLLGATQIVAPRFGRLLTWTLGAAGLNDFLQACFAALTRGQ
jgi:hypothetical protein